MGIKYKLLVLVVINIHLYPFMSLDHIFDLLVLLFQIVVSVNTRQQVALCTPDGGGRYVLGMAPIYFTGVRMSVL